MAETITVLFALAEDPSRSLVADLLSFCGNGSDHHATDPSDSEPEEVVDGLRDGDELVGFRYDRPGASGREAMSNGPAFDYRVGVNRSSFTDLPHVVLFVNDAYFRTERDLDETAVVGAAAALRTFLADLTDAVFDGFEGTLRYVCALDWSDVQRLHGEGIARVVSRESLARGELTYPCWYQVLPPDLATAVGRERLHAAPAWRVADREDGGVLFVVDELPKLPQAGLVTNHDEVLAHLRS